MHGRVLWFNERRGFGFVEGADGRTFFLHINAVVNRPQDEQLAEGLPVAFDSREPDRPGHHAAAVNVRLLGLGD